MFELFVKVTLGLLASFLSEKMKFLAILCFIVLCTSFLERIDGGKWVLVLSCEQAWESTISVNNVLI